MPTMPLVKIATMGGPHDGGVSTIRLQENGKPPPVAVLELRRRTGPTETILEHANYVLRLSDGINTKTRQPESHLPVVKKLENKDGRLTGEVAFIYDYTRPTPTQESDPHDERLHHDE